MAQGNVLTISVVTPDGPVYEGEADLVSCFTTDGSIGIMPNRLALLASLTVDIIQIKRDGKEIEKIAVAGGLLEFSDNQLTVISPAAECAENIDFARAHAALQRAEAHIAEAKASHNRRSLNRAEAALRRAINRIKLSEM